MSRSARALAALLALHPAPSWALASTVAPMPPRPHRAQHSPASAPTTQAAETVEHRAYRLTQLGPFDAGILAAADAHGVDAFVLRALLYVESRHDQEAVNWRTGAVGLAQLTPGGRAAIARLMGRPFTRAMALDPAHAIPAAAQLLAHHLAECGSLELALGAYGSGRCRRLRGFVLSVEKWANRYRAEAGLPSMRVAGGFTF